MYIPVTFFPVIQELTEYKNKTKTNTTSKFPWMSDRKEVEDTEVKVEEKKVLLRTRSGESCEHTAR